MATLEFIGWVILTTIVTIALLALHESNGGVRHGCVHPTAMPATWYGDCN